MKKGLFSVLSLIMLAGPVSPACASTGCSIFTELAHDSIGAIKVIVDSLPSVPSQRLVKAAVFGVVGASVLAMPQALVYFWLRKSRLLVKAHQLLNGSRCESAFLLKCIKKNTADVSKGVERALKHFNGKKYNAVKAVSSIDLLRSEISQFERKLGKLLPYLWLPSSKTKFVSCIAELAQAREFVGNIIDALKASELYKMQIAEQKADERQKHDDKVKLEKAGNTKRTIYTDLKPTPVVNLAS